MQHVQPNTQVNSAHRLRALRQRNQGRAPQQGAVELESSSLLNRSVFGGGQIPRDYRAMNAYSTANWTEDVSGARDNRGTLGNFLGVGAHG